MDDGIDEIALGDPEYQLPHTQVSDATYHIEKPTQQTEPLNHEPIAEKHNIEQHGESKEYIIEYAMESLDDVCVEEGGSDVVSVFCDPTDDYVEENDEIIDDNDSAKTLSVLPQSSLSTEIIPSPFKCDKCSGTFATKKSLNIHVRYNKCIEKSFECHICKRVFISKRTLTLHMPTHLAKRFSCDRCQRQFTRKERLKNHLKDHANDRKHQCPHCPKGKSAHIIHTFDRNFSRFFV